MFRPSKILAVLAALSLAAFSTVAQAASIEIQFTGLNLKYDGTDIYDAVDIAGGIGEPSESDPLTTMTFLQNGTLVGTLNADIYADVFVADALNIPKGGGVIVTGGNGNDFGFDLLTSSGSPGWGLALDIDTLQVFYTGNKIAIAATGLASGVASQTLPFGLVIDAGDQISIVVSSTNLSNVTDNGTFLTGFDASSTGSVKGTLVPEPATYVMGLIGLSGAALLRRIRRRKS